MYRDIDKLCKEFEKISTSVTIVAGDLNCNICGEKIIEQEKGLVC